MTRLIDADAVEKVLEEKHFRRVLDSDRWVIADIKKSIMELPTIDAEPQWIPCSERLPEAKQRVLVTFPDGTVDIKICIDAGHLKWFFAHMVAWMPLPEPYRGGETE